MKVESNSQHRITGPGYKLLRCASNAWSDDMGYIVLGHYWVEFAAQLSIPVP
jgi:hypothetical protein